MPEEKEINREAQEEEVLENQEEEYYYDWF
ncbi:MAG: hypothetical protein A4E53_01061 [Pelotomaculum sp. PtaB.Bin104]|nr:MAG: hypothetical protein A4E53_01061 [Pelotomaculum sp. PtaB.Bin104]